jgi:CRP-like cAMP-binding protein
MSDNSSSEVDVVAASGAQSQAQEECVDSSTKPPPLSQPGAVDDDDTAVLLSRFRSNVKIARRHSTMLSTALVYPIPEVSTGEAPADTPMQKPKKILRRSSTIRGLAQTSKALFTGLSRAQTGASAQAAATVERSHDKSKPTIVGETPYEEMMMRFQIRQLQRTASGMTARSASFASSRVMEANTTGRRSNGHESITADSTLPDQGCNLPSRLTSFRASIRPSSTHDRVTETLNGLASTDYTSSTSPEQLQGDGDIDKLPDQDTAHDASGRKHRWLSTLRMWQAHLSTPFSPLSEFSQARYLAGLLVAATYIIVFPLGVAFHEEEYFSDVDSVVGILFGVDVLLTLHTSYVDKDGSVVTAHRQIARHYLKTRFVLDALLIVPLMMHVDAKQGSRLDGSWVHVLLDILSAERLAYVARLVRMVWLMRLNSSGSGNNLWAWILYSRYSHLMRIAAIITMLVCIAHYIACIWTVLLNDGQEGESPPSWQYQYSESFYAALLLLQGEGVPTDTAGQNLFASLSVLVGSIVLAVVFGHVAILVANFNANFTSYQRKMEAVIAMTAKLQLPAPLRQRIHEYYEHLWHEYECIDGEIVQFSKELSHTLGLEVVLFKYMELVMHVPFWRDSTPDFQKQLMLRLDVRVYLPNDFIMREGEVDDEFYMINRGHCELSRDLDNFERITNTMTGDDPNANRGRRRLAGSSLDDGHGQSAYELDAAQRQYYSNVGRRGALGYEVMVSRGQAFGDLALLMNYPRAANVRAITHVEMCVLSRENFQAVLTRYPEDRRCVVVDMLTSYMQSYEASQLSCPLLETVRSLYTAKAIAEVCAKVGMAPPRPPPLLTARQAAERVYLAINVDLKDTTLKFGLGGNIRDQLVALRDTRRQKRAERHPRSILGNTAPSAAVNACGRACSSRQRERDSDAGHSELTPVERVLLAPSTQPLVHLPAPSWQARLQQAEEREVAILRALQELQANFKLLQARQSPPGPEPAQAEVPPVKRKRSTPESESTAPLVKAPPTAARPKLLQRMGSLVGLTSGADFNAKEQMSESPTRYADQLFHTHVTTLSSQATTQQPSRPHSRVSRSATFAMLASDKAPHREAKKLADAPVGGTNTVSARIEHPRRKLFQRSRSQILQTLAEGMQHPGSVGSSANLTGDLFRRASPAACEPSESPTRYADALFRPRMPDALSPSTETETSTMDHIGTTGKSATNA